MPGQLSSARSPCEVHEDRPSHELPETVYTTKFVPDISKALDVLAFVLTPVRAFVNASDEEEVALITELLNNAKIEAILGWCIAVNDARAN